nr:SH3 domain-containing protein [Hyphomonadaceae bacterium]
AAMLPWAGVDSICPECGAPLALISRTPSDSAATGIAHQPQGVPGHAANVTASPPRSPAPDIDWDGNQSDSFPDEDRPQSRGNGLLVASVLVLLALAGGFVAWRLFGNQDQASAGLATAGPVNGSNAAVADFVELSPPDMLEVTTAVVAVDGPGAGAGTVGQIAAGTVVDVTGVSGTETSGWARIVMPDRQTVQAWVPRRVLGRLQAMAQAEPLDPASRGLEGANPDLQGDIAAGASAQAVPRFVAYVARSQVNVRSAPAATASLVAQLPRGEGVIVNAAAATADGVWYRIDSQTGGEAWIKADLLRRDRPDGAGPATGGVPGQGATDGALGQPPQGGTTPDLGGDPDPAPPATDPASSDGTPLLEKPPVQQPQSGPPDGAPGTNAGANRPSRVVVSVPQANLRRLPVIEEGNVMFSLANGTALRVLQSRTIRGRIWYEVRAADGTIGWVSSATVSVGR